MDPIEIKAQIEQALQPILDKLNALEAQNQQIRAILKNANLPKANIKPHPTVSTHLNSKVTCYTDKKPVTAAGKSNETGHKPVHQKKEEPKGLKKVEDGHSEGADHSLQTSETQKKCQNINNLEQPPVKPTIGPKPTTAKKPPAPAPGVEVGKKVTPIVAKTPVTSHKGPATTTNTKIKTEAAQDEEKKKQESNKKKSISQANDKYQKNFAAKSPIGNKNLNKDVASNEKKTQQENVSEKQQDQNVKKQQQIEVDTSNKQEPKQQTNQQTSQKIEQAQPEPVHPQQNLLIEEQNKQKQEPTVQSSENAEQVLESPQIAAETAQGEQVKDSNEQEVQVSNNVQTQKKTEDDEVL